MHFYRKLDLEPIPLELLSSLKLYPNKSIDDIGYGHQYRDSSGEFLTSSTYSTDFIPPEYNEEFMRWLIGQLPGNVRGNWVMQVSASRTPCEPATHIAHTDMARRVAINYIIDTGGPNVTTNWYKEQGKELHRPYKQHGQSVEGTDCLNYFELELLESVVFEKNCWYMIQTDVLHDVRNITGSRTSLTGNFDNFWCNYFRTDLFSRTS